MNIPRWVRWAFILTSGLLLLPMAQAASDDCLSVALKLHDLQNLIVENSFRRLPVGAWAKYRRGPTRVDHLGEQTSPHSGEKLYMAAVEGAGPIREIGYRLREKKVVVGGRSLGFSTIEVREMYVQIGPQLYYLPSRMIDMYVDTMLGGGAKPSVIFFRGQIVSPPNCRHLPSIHEEDYALPSGKHVRAVRIVSGEHGGSLLVSPGVPYGLVLSRSGTGTPGMTLVDFGMTGGKPSLKEVERRQALVFNLPFLNHGLPLIPTQPSRLP